MATINPTVNQAEVAGAISSYYGVSPNDGAVAKLLGVILPDVQTAAASGAVSWKSVFPSVLAKYESMARDLGLGISPQQRELDAARIANPAGAGLKGLDSGLLAGLHRGSLPLAMHDDGDSRRSGDRVATTAALTRDAPFSAVSAIGYTRELGMNPALAGFFVGASTEMRDALRGAIQKGTSITDDHVKSMNDVSAVLGAIRAGKLKADDPRVPPSVRKIIDDMKAKGIDPVTAKPDEIKKYLKEHPDALDAAKKANDKALKSVAPKSDDQLKDSNLKKGVQVDPKGNNAAAKVQTAKL